ncbi:hypothetical protein [Desulfoluna spongiiphila]|uniref:hypothetical protein n=1 Tax=Desulfoluna spongiiphila TaxID=419481 RepID=UPI0020C90087|nr:hypothetical protein [Desulfoluna spongiiphila]
MEFPIQVTHRNLVDLGWPEFPESRNDAPPVRTSKHPFTGIGKKEKQEHVTKLTGLVFLQRLQPCCHGPDIPQKPLSFVKTHGLQARHQPDKIDKLAPSIGIVCGPGAACPHQIPVGQPGDVLRQARPRPSPNHPNSLTLLFGGDVARAEKHHPKHLRSQFFDLGHRGLKLGFQLFIETPITHIKVLDKILIQSTEVLQRPKGVINKHSPIVFNARPSPMLSRVQNGFDIVGFFAAISAHKGSPEWIRIFATPVLYPFW